jgi:hypothetical protein
MAAGGIRAKSFALVALLVRRSLSDAARRSSPLWAWILRLIATGDDARRLSTDPSYRPDDLSRRVWGTALTEIEVGQDGRSFCCVLTPGPAESLALRAVGVALQPTVQAVPAA